MISSVPPKGNLGGRTLAVQAPHRSERRRMRGPREVGWSSFIDGASRAIPSHVGLGALATVTRREVCAPS